jgi:CRISPR system Cascade subunit CasD
MANTLFLRLEGPLQAWGERARWSVRDTSTEPTKSGVVGLLGCALGFLEDADLVDLSRRTKMGVRCDREGVTLTDFQTIIGGILNAEGKVKDDTSISWRSYLCDASFLVALQADNALINRLSAALQHPAWPVYLGRRSCVPARPIFEGVGDYPDLTSALKDWTFPVSQVPGRNTVRAVIEAEAGEGVQRRDEVLSRRYRTFLPRYVKEVQLPLNFGKEAV